MDNGWSGIIAFLMVVGMGIFCCYSVTDDTITSQRNLQTCKDNIRFAINDKVNVTGYAEPLIVTNIQCLSDSHGIRDTVPTYVVLNAQGQSNRVMGHLLSKSK